MTKFKQYFYEKKHLNLTYKSLFLRILDMNLSKNKLNFEHAKGSENILWECSIR